MNFYLQKKISKIFVKISSQKSLQNYQNFFSFSKYRLIFHVQISFQNFFTYKTPTTSFYWKFPHQWISPQVCFMGPLQFRPNVLLFTNESEIQCGLIRVLMNMQRRPMSMIRLVCPCRSVAMVCQPGACLHIKVSHFS